MLCSLTKQIQTNWSLADVRCNQQHMTVGIFVVSTGILQMWRYGGRTISFVFHMMELLKANIVITTFSYIYMYFHLKLGKNALPDVIISCLDISFYEFWIVPIGCKCRLNFGVNRNMFKKYMCWAFSIKRKLVQHPELSGVVPPHKYLSLLHRN